jgi:hypothetical protein
VVIELPVRIARGDRVLSATTTNVSLGGMQVRAQLDPAPQLGERLAVELELETLDRPIRVDVEVRWIDAQDPRRVGLQFVSSLRAREMWALARCLDRPGAQPG